jgi:hypothetical protein
VAALLSAFILAATSRGLVAVGVVAEGVLRHEPAAGLALGLVLEHQVVELVRASSRAYTS